MVASKSCLNLSQDTVRCCFEILIFEDPNVYKRLSDIDTTPCSIYVVDGDIVEEVDANLQDLVLIGIVMQSIQFFVNKYQWNIVDQTPSVIWWSYESGAGSTQPYANKLVDDIAFKYVIDLIIFI